MVVLKGYYIAVHQPARKLGVGVEKLVRGMYTIPSRYQLSPLSPNTFDIKISHHCRLFQLECLLPLAYGIFPPVSRSVLIVCQDE